MIKIGDRVKFISDTGVGIVRSVNNGIAQVEVDGFEIPALTSDIIAVDATSDEEARRRIGPDSNSSKHSNSSQKSTSNAAYGKIAIEDDFEDEPIDIQAIKRQYAAYQKSQTKNQSAPAAIVIEPPYKLDDYRVLLMFVAPNTNAVEPESEPLDLYLVNDSTYEVFYSIGLKERQGYLTTLSCGKIQADTKEKIHNFTRSKLANIMDLEISLLPYKPLNYTSQPVTQTQIELHPMKFVRANNFTENDYFDQKALTFTLADSSKK